MSSLLRSTTITFRTRYRHNRHNLRERLQVMSWTIRVSQKRTFGIVVGRTFYRPDAVPVAQPTVAISTVRQKIVCRVRLARVYKCLK